MDGGGTPGGSSAGLFLPPNQGAAAQGFQDIVKLLTDQGLGNLTTLGQPPAQTAFPFVENAAFGTINNPYQPQALQGGFDAQNIYQNQLSPGTFDFATMMQGLGRQAAGAGGNPAYGQAGQMGGQFAPELAGMGSQIWKTAQNISPQIWNEATTLAPKLSGMGDTIANQAFDPQGQLFQRTQSQLLDQSNAANAMYGLGSSPYGASTTANAVGNFDLNWQNNLLDRMTKGGQAASGLDQAALQSLISGGNASLQSLIGGGQATAGLDQAALQSLLTPANNQVTALLQGAGAAGQAGGAGLNALTELGRGAPGFMAGPYNTQNTIQGNNMGALQNLIALGNQQYTVPQQAVQDLNQYMGLGQAASGLANTIGATNFNENAAMFQGAGNLLGGPLGFGGGGGGGGGLLGDALGLGGGGGIGGLFGGGLPADVAATGGLFDIPAAAAPLAFSA